MKKKGFTLMELLAVIVILAVLALITIPIVSNLIKNSKKEAFRISVGQVSDNIFFHYTKDWLIEGMDEDKVFDFETHQNLDLLTVSGSLPTSGSMSINPQGKISINVSNGVYCAVKGEDQDKIQVGDIVDGVCQLTGEEVSTCSVRVGYTWNFDYIATGEDRSQEFTVPCDGNYKLEVWGAQGGRSLQNNSLSGDTGYGGYSTGSIELKTNDKLYVNVGGKGENAKTSGCAAGGYNGGGRGSNDGGACNYAADDDAAGGGGGATHIAFDSGLLTTFENKQDKLLIVAGGGGGNNWDVPAGSGGGFKGGVNSYTPSNEVSQTTGYAFGKGADSQGIRQQGTCTSTSTWSCTGVAGGGGGYYGGFNIDLDVHPASGGSGYIGNSKLKNKFMYCYDCETSTEVNTYTITGKMFSDNASSATAKKGNGYARIIYLGKNSSSSSTCIAGLTAEFNYKEVDGNGVEQTYIPACTGYYKLEVWGAQGGNSGVNYPGGYGGYSTGIIKLNKDLPIYINVGGQGKAASGYRQYAEGGYNGGGRGYTHSSYSRYVSGGGGATHIALASGILKNFNPNLENSIHDKLIIVAGGGSGTWNMGSKDNWETREPGHGGGFKGSTSVSASNSVLYYGSGGTQTSGYAFGQGMIAETSPLAGGGGGYWGGLNGSYGIGGGSGYIGYSMLYTKSMYCYNCETSSELSTKTKATTNKSSNPISKYVKQGNGYAKITYIGETYDTSIQYEEGEEWLYSYKEENGSGVEQTFTVPVTGKYKIEVWGASGGNMNSIQGGKGAYASGLLELNKGTNLYVYIGEHIDGYADKVTFNGGGRGSYSNNREYNANGGGSTDVRLVNGSWDSFDSLKSRIIVAAGGGGANDIQGYRNLNGGSGGTLTGISGNKYCGNSTCGNLEVAAGGTQIQGGLYANPSPTVNGSSLVGGFGRGGSSTKYNADWIYYAGGGSGYYGGGAGGAGSNIIGSGAGGSSFISGYPGCNAISKDSTESNIIHTDQPNHYSGYIFTSGVMKSGDEDMPSYNSTSTMTGNTGNGYARITLLEIK